MKRLALASILLLTQAIAGTGKAWASGFILIDTLGGAPPPSINPVNVRPPLIRPDRFVPQPIGRPVLHGSVSYGLHLQAENIKVDINDQVAKTYITQTFKNDTDRNLAGTYLFPLPDDTTFSSFSLHIDGKPVEGKILAAAEARQQYEAIVRRMVDPGLLEYADYKTVRARIFPIPAHGSKKVELEYTQVLKAENGMLKYSFPLKAKGGDEPIDDIKIDVKLSSKEGLRTIWSPTHIISASKMSDTLARAAFHQTAFRPDKDFLLYYSVSDRALAANLLTHRATAEDGYFLMTLTPPVKSRQIIGKDIVLVADTSGSMQGEKIGQAKEALKYIVKALNPEDRFGLIQFNTDADALGSKLLQATAENKKSAEAFIEDLDARGGTNIGDALRMGATMLDEQSSRPAYLVLMTDGEPTVGETDTDRLLKTVQSKRDVRIFDFGVGYEVNTRFLNKLAESNHGTSQYVAPGENLETALSGFYQKIKSPVLSDVKIAYEGIQVKDVYPRSVKDIFAGTQVLLIGKYKAGGNAVVRLSGTVNGAARSYSFPLSFSQKEAAHTYLPRLWAMRRIGYLTEVAQSNGNNKEIVDEIVLLSRRFGIISAYTSFLVTDPGEGQVVAARPTPRPSVRFDSPVRKSDGLRRGQMPPPVPSQSSTAGFAEEMRAGNFRGSADKKELAQTSQAGAYVLKQIAMAPSSGRAAVTREKSINKLKSSVALEDSSKAATIKIAHDKTFYLKGGVWTDSAYEPAKGALTTIEFGSSKYFDLVRANPGLARYLSVGANVIVVFDGRAYRIVAPPRSAT